MYFLTMFKNDFNDINDINDNEICIICWGLSEKKNKLIKMKSLSHVSHFSKKCDCNCIIHSECLIKWININNSCLICHKPIYNTKLQYKNTLKQQLNQQICVFLSFLKYIIIYLVIRNYTLFIFRLVHQIENLN